MEWCRMFSLRIVVCSVLLGCGLSIPRPDTSMLTSERSQKLQKLLESLKEYSPATDNLSTAKKLPYHDLDPSPSPTPPPAEDASFLVNGETDKNAIPNHEEFPTYQDYFRKRYGTEEGVAFLRTHYGPEGLERARANFRSVTRGMQDVKQANLHYRTIRNRTRCSAPVPQIVRVKDYYPDPSKDYLPRCTILHRCSDSTGCCDSDAFHCVASAIQEVQLYFYALTAMSATQPKNSVEKLLFANHTACQCQPINDLPRIQDGRDHLLDGTDPPSTSKCRECPVPFTSRTYKDGRCGCDCFDRQKPCLRIKRGKDPLMEIERRCVESNHCHIPDCEHGQYSLESGYCPRRHDEEPRTHHHRRPNRPTPNHRWAFHERD